MKMKTNILKKSSENKCFQKFQNLEKLFFQALDDIQMIFWLDFLKKLWINFGDWMLVLKIDV